MLYTQTTISELDNLIKKRQKYAKLYTQELSTVEWLYPPKELKGYDHSWQAYVCFVDEKKAPLPRNKLMDHLLKRGIATRPGTHAVHMLSLYQKRFDLAEDSFPGARDCYLYSIALPLHNRITEEDYKFIITTLKET